MKRYDPQHITNVQFLDNPYPWHVRVRQGATAGIALALVLGVILIHVW